jgi:hypothetical protein
MSTVRVYRSTDPGAPAHPSATLGSQAAQLRACLVTGYGNISITSLVVSGAVATATVDGGNTLGIGTVIEISGATPTTLNGEWRINAADASTFSFPATGIADCAAMGTITATIPGAGWEEPFAESGNIACFRAFEGARQFYQIDDTQADADVAKVRAFESMSDVSTGQGQWGAKYFGKRFDATYSQEWIVFADERTVYVWLSSRYGMIPHGFGEFDSTVTNDPYNSFCAGHNTASYLPYGNIWFDLNYSASVGRNSKFSVHKSIYGTTGAGTSMVALGNAGPPGGGNNYTDVSQIEGQNFMYLPVAISCIAADENSQYLVRGKLRGIYQPLAGFPITHGETYIDDGKTLLALDVRPSANITYNGQLHTDISGSWD